VNAEMYLSAPSGRLRPNQPTINTHWVYGRRFVGPRDIRAGRGFGECLVPRRLARAATLKPDRRRRDPARATTPPASCRQAKKQLTQRPGRPARPIRGGHQGLGSFRVDREEEKQPPPRRLLEHAVRREQLCGPAYRALLCTVLCCSGLRYVSVHTTSGGAWP